MSGRIVKSTKVVIADDHPIVRSGIKKTIEKEPGYEVVAEVGSGEKVLELARTAGFHIDIVITDLKMPPGIDGLVITRALKRINPDIAVVVLTAYNDDIFASHLLQAGASGYLTKDANAEEMIRAIRTVRAGQRYISPKIASQLAIKHLTDQGQSPFDLLSEREMQVCLMVTSGKSVQDIANKLCLSPKTVNSYRYRIFEKIGVPNDVSLTHMAIRHKLLEDILEDISDDS